MLPALDIDELSPLMVADLRFTYARALWAARPNERPAALELARTAAAGQRDSVHGSPKAQRDLDAIEAWLRDK